ncbi:hypothetical protein OQA88_5685 [Cercophora sp. LCS_1]
MAPSKTNKPKTPRRTSVKSQPTKTPFSKVKARPNHKITEFFRKTAEDDLFMGDGAPSVPIDNDDDEADDLFGSSDEDEVGSNKAGGAAGDKAASNNDAGEDEKSPATKGKAAMKKKAAPIAKPVKKRTVGGFLVDSSDEDDDDDDDDVDNDVDNDDAEPKAKRAKRVRANSDDSENEEGIDVLTNDTRFPRTLPLLRQETSGSGGVVGPDADSDADAYAAAPKEKRNTGGQLPFGGDGMVDDQFEGYQDLTDADFDQIGEGQWGEEFREMRYMQEQAQLEAQEAGVANPDRVDVMEECCPICNASLAGVTEQQATAHVNGCLDGTPIPLPEPPDGALTKTGDESVVDGAEVGKRFAKAAVPRPGQTNPISLGDDATAVASGSSKSAFTKLMSSHAEDAAWATAAAAETASRGMPAYKRTCPFYKIMPGFFICVDAFRYGAVEGCNAYFLSHFHSDHYIGLTANWTHGLIYCSRVTGSLVKSQLRTAAKYVVELEFDMKVTIPGTQGVQVTMIPANHCPGSSLFLFEKPLGPKRRQRILHCGDFRACPAHVAHPELRPETIDAISGKTSQHKIDVCYLDTTYLNPRYSFPPQDDVIRSCAGLCANLNNSLARDDESVWNSLLRRREGGAPPGVDGVTKFFKPEKPSPQVSPVGPVPSGSSNAFTAIQNGSPNRNRLLVVCGTYSIGKERICIAIAQALRTKIFASPSKIKICKQLDDPELSALLTSDPHEAQVHMQMLMEIRADTLAEYLEIHNRHFSRIVGFRPSGWNFRPSGNTAGANVPPSSVPSTQILHGPGWRTRFQVNDLVPQRGSHKGSMCFGVPYSEHSSFRELAMFLMALRIEKVVPTVNVGSEQSRKRMKGWTDRWLAERRRGGLVRVTEGDEEAESKEGLWDGKDGKGGGVYW